MLALINKYFFLFKIYCIPRILKRTKYKLSPSSSASKMSSIPPLWALWPSNDVWGIWYLFKHWKLLQKFKNLSLSSKYSGMFCHMPLHPLSGHWKAFFFPLLIFVFKFLNQPTWSPLPLKTLESMLEIVVTSNCFRPKPGQHTQQIKDFCFVLFMLF